MNFRNSVAAGAGRRSTTITAGSLCERMRGTSHSSVLSCSASQSITTAPRPACCSAASAFFTSPFERAILHARAVGLRVGFEVPAIPGVEPGRHEVVVGADVRQLGFDEILFQGEPGPIA